MMGIGCFTINASCGNERNQRLFCEFSFWSWHKLFSFEKSQRIFGWLRCLSLFKSFATRWFFLSFLACDKIFAIFHLVWEMHNIFMHYQPDRKLSHCYVPGYGLTWLAGIIVKHGLDFTNKFGRLFLNQNDQIGLVFLFNGISTFVGYLMPNIFS